MGYIDDAGADDVVPQGRVFESSFFVGVEARFRTLLHDVETRALLLLLSHHKKHSHDSHHLPVSRHTTTASPRNTTAISQDCAPTSRRGSLEAA